MKHLNKIHFFSECENNPCGGNIRRGWRPTYASTELGVVQFKYYFMDTNVTFDMHFEYGFMILHGLS